MVRAPNIPTLRFLGCFAVDEVDPVASPMRFGGSNCVLMLQDSSTLLVSSQKGRHFAPIPIPNALWQEAPVWNAGGWYDCPVRVSRDGAWRQFYDPAEVSKSIPPERFDGRGATFIDGEPIQTTHFFYNANVAHVGAYWWRGEHRKTDPTNPSKENALNGQYTAGYVFPIPEPWRSKWAMRVACGNHTLQQTGSAFLGPCLLGLEPDTGEIKLAMHPQRSHWLYHDGGRTFRKRDAVGMDDIALERATYDIEYTTRTTSAAILGDTLYHFGVRGAGKGWYGERDAVIGGRTYRDVAATSKGFHNERREWTCYVTPMNAIERVGLRDLHPWDVESFTQTWDFTYDVAAPGQIVGETPVGCVADHARNKLYVAVSMRTRRNAEMTPVVLVFERDKAVVTFDASADGVRVLRDGVPTTSPKLVDWLNANDEAKEIVRGE